MHFLKHSLCRGLLGPSFFVLSLTACGSGLNSFLPGSWTPSPRTSTRRWRPAPRTSSPARTSTAASSAVHRTAASRRNCVSGGRYRRPAHLYIYLKDGLTYTASKGRSLRLRHHRRGLRLRVPADVPPRHQLPLRRGFSALENSAAVLAGQKPASALGVTAAEPLKLEVPTLLAR